MKIARLSVQIDIFLRYFIPLDPSAHDPPIKRSGGASCRVMFQGVVKNEIFVTDWLGRGDLILFPFIPRCGLGS